jgi:hypothetical protein
MIKGFKVGDRVNITDYGDVKPSDEFEVIQAWNNGYSVKLDNGLFINSMYLKLSGDVKLDKKDVLDVVDNWVSDNLSFTAYDVTQELRKDNPNIDVKHDWVKKIVHDYYDYETFSSPYYVKDLIDVGKPNLPPPWLYYPDGDDITSYVPNKGPQDLSKKPVSATKKFIYTFS